jgi:cell division protease FtsH
MPRHRLAALLALSALAVAALCGPASAKSAPSFSQQPNARATHDAEPTDLSFSAFLAAARAHRIRSLTLPEASNVATVVLRSGKTRTTVLPASDTALLERLARDGVEVELGASRRTFLPTFAFSLMLAVLLAGISFAIVSARRRGSGGGPGSLRPALQMGLRPSAVAPQVSEVRFHDVAGCPEAVEELQELVEFLTAPERFQRLGAKTPRAALLYGPSGTGKTLLAKALAGEVGIPFYALSGSELVEKYVGVGAARVRELFARARKEENGAVIFFDEIDAVARARAGAEGGNDSEREQTLNELLVQLDGFGSSEKVICIAATNRRDILDPALLRPGRFGRQVPVDLPSEQGRREILEVHASGKPLAEDADLDRVATLSAGMSGAELAELLNEAAIMAARAGRDAIVQADLDEGQLRVMLGPEKQQVKLADGELEVVSYHEAGHALAAELCPNHENPQKVTVRQRGRTGGLAFFGRTDRLLEDVDHIHERMVVALAGRAAEQLVFGKVSSGAANDLEVVNGLARHAVQTLGLSRALGQLTSGTGLQRHQLSNETLAVADREVGRLVADAYRDAIDLLGRNRAALDRLAELLVTQRDLERVDIELVVDGLEPAVFRPEMGPTALAA